MDGRLGWGIAGCGWVARDFVAPAITESGSAAAALLDPSEDALAQVGGVLPEARRHQSLESFLAEPGLDAVYVAAPNHLHRELAEAAAAAGKHVLCEKPLAPALADAAAIVDACEAAGVRCATAFDQRFHAAHRRLRRMISEGVLGTVCSVRIHYACWLPPRWSADNWRADPARAGGGALTDLAPHGLDLAQHLLGEEIVSVSARLQRRVFDYPVEDGAALVGDTESGALFIQHVSYNTPEVYPRRTLEISGTRALALATDTLGQEPGGTLELVDASDGARTRVSIPKEEDRSPFTAQIEAFSRAVLDNEALPADARRELHTVRLLEEAAAPAGSPKPPTSAESA